MRTLTLTAAKIALLEKHMKLGVPMTKVFVASNVSSKSYYRWMRSGRAIAEEDLEHPDFPQPLKHLRRESDSRYRRRLRRYNEGLELYATLYEKMKKASAEVHIKMVEGIRSAAPNGDWRAALAFLIPLCHNGITTLSIGRSVRQPRLPMKREILDGI